MLLFSRHEINKINLLRHFYVLRVLRTPFVAKVTIFRGFYHKKIFFNVLLTR
eukprot:TRINITY_DN63_c1_g1_i1.p1 TRINITY_DN63_c1_g1~~TRINITY_DN63_c1_g1_i1.p1  ORF type:complete len:52 (+),score=0.69 TRINITY_DN63_c1_g1_i1:96-251(+)